MIETSAQSLYSWLKRFEGNGGHGLVDRLRPPETAPTRLAANVEALVCELRRAHPCWRHGSLAPHFQRLPHRHRE